MPPPKMSHCRRGHPFDEENTRIQAGKRVCRRCIADRAKKYYHEKGLKDKRDKQADRAAWRRYYRADPEKHRARNEAERIAADDNYIASLIADKNRELRKAARNFPELIAAYRAQLKLKRLIHERSE